MVEGGRNKQNSCHDGSKHWYSTECHLADLIQSWQVRGTLRKPTAVGQEH
jgi:hypothetical protein